MEAMARHHGLGPLMSRSVEYDTKNHMGHVVRYVFEKAVVTYQNGQYSIEPK
jgi:hypothetical protein